MMEECNILIDELPHSVVVNDCIYVAEGLIDTLGSLHDAMDCLDKMIAAEKNKQRAKPRKGKKSL